jgi:uncharacterized OB-fold protein
MTYLPPDLPIPAPEPWELQFWDFCRQRTLRFQSCMACGQIRHPPVPCCPVCRSFDDRWVEATDDAELFTFTIVHHIAHPVLRHAVPYNAAVVMFPSLQSVRLVTNIVDCPDEDLRVGLKLTLSWEEPQPGSVLPRFRPAGGLTA